MLQPFELGDFIIVSSPEAAGWLKENNPSAFLSLDKVSNPYRFRYSGMSNGGELLLLDHPENERRFIYPRKAIGWLTLAPCIKYHSIWNRLNA